MKEVTVLSVPQMEINSFYVSRLLEAQDTLSHCFIPSSVRMPLSMKWAELCNMAGEHPVTLQLLVENVIKHNSMSPGKPMTIRIETEKEELKVSNPVSPKKKADTPSGIGLKNLSPKIQVGHPYQRGEGFGFQVVAQLLIWEGKVLKRAFNFSGYISPLAELPHSGHRHGKWV